MNIEKIIDQIEAKGAKFVKVAITDIDGVLRGKIIHIDKLKSALKSGLGFCNVVFGWDVADICYENTDYTGWHTGYPDAQAKLDPNTLRFIPWDGDKPFFLGDFVNDHDEPLEVCPRSTLKRVIKKAASMDIKILAGFEFEFFNFKESSDSLNDKGFTKLNSLTPGMFGYSLLRSSEHRDYFNAIVDELSKFNVPVEGLHTETGPGVYEAALQVTDALEAADIAVLFKTSVKEIAQRYSIKPTFMAKWSSELPGCSGHLHQSAWGIKNNNNLFYSKDGEPNETFKSYLAGQMLLMPELLPFFAPTINSYKRLVEGLWAPTTVTWGLENRTSSFRAILGGEKSSRLETRTGGADLNPYLALAAAIASGLYGIENKLELKHEPIKGNAYKAKNATKLPDNLYNATEKMKNSKLARELFGDTFINHFVQTREWEWQQHQVAVTDWELKRYFEII